MRAFNDAQLNKKSFRIPSGVTLRECSVVIIGSTCKICGRDFKCESDVSLHSRWRHNGTIGSLIDDLHHEIYLENIQKCDICDVQFQIASDLKIHKRLIHKHGTRSKYKKKKRRKETVRVKFKLNGMTTMDVNLNRKYLKMENNLKYFIDTGTQTPDSLEIEKHQDNCAAHIDLFLSDHVVDNNHIQHIRPHKPANRYIVGKFTSTKGDAIARSTTIVGRSLLEISNTSHRDVIPDSNKSCEEYENHSNFISQENTADTWIRSFLNNLDTYNKENSQGNLNEPKRKNVYCQAEFLLNDNNVPLTYQREKFDKTSLTSKQLANEIRYDPIKQFNKAAKDKRSAELTNSLADSEEIVIDNENNKIYETATKHPFAPLTRNFFNKKIESIKGNSNVDDDIQEVLRITRRNVQSDINHESPNRTEREILIQNTGNKLPFPIQRKSTIYPEKCNAGFTANFEPSSYPAFTTVTESSYQFLANAFNKKLGIYLKDMHHLGISYYNELTEINNNNLEDYAIYAHQGFFESRMQAEEP